MATVEMTRVRFNPQNDVGGWYSNVVALTEPGTSDTYVLPVAPVISDMGVSLSGAGTGTIEFTLGTPDEIVAGTATFVAWDGTSKINNAVTAWRVVSTLGAVTGRVIVKTRKA